MAVIQSTDLLHESACGLQDDNHQIDEAFVTVMRTAADRAPVDCDFGAAGCGSCFTTDDPAGVFYTAQNDATETVPVNFDSEDEDFTREDLGELIVDVAVEQHVPVSWNQDVNSCVVLGSTDYYENLPVGTKVRDDRGTEGIVLDPDLVNPDMDYVVRAATEGFGRGDVIARFEDRDDAEAFADEEQSVGRAMQQGTKDGDVIVQFEGHSAPTLTRTSSLDVLD